MKKLIFLFISLFVFGLALPTTSFAQGMMGFSNLSIDNSAIQSQQQEEQEGKEFLDHLNNKKVACSQLNDSDFEKIGEYFMGQSIGDTARHITMNEMMKRMMGEKGEEQAHTAMGKRLSNCDTSAAFPAQNDGFWPMLNMMGGWSSPSKVNQTNNNPMMWNFSNNPMGWGFGFFGWIFMILMWTIIIAGIFALIKWLSSQSHNSHGYEKSPLEILKERYAKGEIDKNEFEKRKNDLS